MNERNKSLCSVESPVHVSLKKICWHSFFSN